MKPVSLGLMASVGQTIDAFFPEMITFWRSQGVDVHVGAGSPTHVDGSVVLKGITRSPSILNARGLLSTRAWVRGNMLGAVITSTATVSAIARLTDMGAPVIYFCHGLHWSDSHRGSDIIWKSLEKALLRNTAGIIVLNAADQTWFEFNAPTVPILRLQYGVGVDLTEFPRSDPTHNEILRFVWIGEFIPRKRPQHALMVARRLASMGLKFRLDMLGDGPMWAQVREEVEREPLLSDIVRLHGRQPARDFLASCDALIHTAIWEGLPRVMLEALAIGRPIYSYDIKGSRDLPMTCLAPSGDSNALASVIAARARSGSRELYPRPELLSSTRAAQEILDFIANVIPAG